MAWFCDRVEIRAVDPGSSGAIVTSLMADKPSGVPYISSIEVWEGVCMRVTSVYLRMFPTRRIA